jgi:hypothetical protein
LSGSDAFGENGTSRHVADKDEGLQSSRGVPEKVQGNVATWQQQQVMEERPGIQPDNESKTAGWDQRPEGVASTISIAATAEKLPGGRKSQGLDGKGLAGRVGNPFGVGTASSSGAITVNMLSAMEAVRQSWLHEEQQRQQYSSSGGGVAGTAAAAEAGAGWGLGGSMSRRAYKHSTSVSSRSTTDFDVGGVCPTVPPCVGRKGAPTAVQVPQQQAEMGNSKSFNLAAGLRGGEGSAPEDCCSPAWVGSVKHGDSSSNDVQYNETAAAAAARQPVALERLPRPAAAQSPLANSVQSGASRRQSSSLVASPGAPKGPSSLELLDIGTYISPASAEGKVVAASDAEGGSVNSPSSRGGIKPILRSTTATPRTVSARHRVHIREMSDANAAELKGTNSSTASTTTQVDGEMDSSKPGGSSELALGEGAVPRVGEVGGLVELIAVTCPAEVEAAVALTLRAVDPGYQDGASALRSPAAVAGAARSFSSKVVPGVAYHQITNHSNRSSGGGALPQPAGSSSIFSSSSSCGISWPQHQKQAGVGSSTRSVQLPYISAVQPQPSASGSSLLFQSPPALLLTDADDVAAPAFSDEQLVDAECYSPATPCEGGKRNAVMMRRLHKKKSLKRLEVVMLGVAAHQGEEDAEEVAAAALAAAGADTP